LKESGSHTGRDAERRRQDARRTGKERRGTEPQLRDLIENPLIGVYRTSIAGAFLYANETMAQMLGFASAEALMQENVRSFYRRPDDRARLVEILRAAERRWPSDADVLNALGTIQVRRNALGEAIETFERAARANPQDPLAFFNLGRTYELRYFAMRRFSRPSSRWVDNPEFLNKAIENYEACTKLGGPYAEDARAAIDRLRNIR
jgi:PAS domain-containing protein